MNYRQDSLNTHTKKEENIFTADSMQGSCEGFSMLKNQTTIQCTNIL